ncbi:MAG: hypothetical protein GWP10_16545 [Nitrospiraceae bacterium]|nr:hypothetical protein [Nitrospiraceae bacterium]
MRRLIIADAHLGQRRGDLGDMAVLLRRAADAGAGEIVYLGDAFQYLIGIEKLWTADVRRMLAVWDEIRAEGVRIVLIEGNRDFFLDEPELAVHHDGAFLTYEFEAGPKRFRLTHGDRVNQRDHQYLFWRMISKCGVSRRAARALPRRVAVTIVRRMEIRLATTNRRFRYHKPVKALTAEAAKAWRDGVDVLLWGHFHSPWRCAREGRVALIVPAWLETGLGVLVEPSGSWSLVEKTLTPPSEPLKMEECPESIDS